MLRPNPRIIPPNGWHIMQAHNGGMQKIEADTLEELYKAVLEFRLANGIPPGPIQQDVDGYICSHFPRACQSIGDFTPTTGNAPHPSSTNRWVDRVLQWLNAMRLMPPALVEPLEAQERMNRCRQCPHNQRMVSGCDKCDTNVRELAFFIRQGRKLPNDEALQCCNKLNLELKTAVWMPKERIKGEAGLPAICPYRI